MDYLIGSIMLWGGNFAPRGWLACEGQLLSIASNTTLYTILGTTYGGDGVTTFALPDLRGRVATSAGQGPGLSYYTLGEQVGTESNTLTTAQMAMHTHGATGAVKVGANSGDEQDSNSPVDSYPRATPGVNTYAASANALMGASQFNVTMGPAGGNQPVPNMMPTLSMYFCICVEGIYPSHN
ncbi:phage tail protein [Flavobacterium magnum]|uniref:Phage tail protein n=1 Tax=Flavobacterium magnum TaxID=2162713 RepID=A0A2S0RD60_9FLAO|nr:tail fiber protein [Flavobacterium magnum]AWA29877.1 phage tail protein [Flavobacterium magnum]